MFWIYQTYKIVLKWSQAIVQIVLKQLTIVGQQLRRNTWSREAVKHCRERILGHPKLLDWIRDQNQGGLIVKFESQHRFQEVGEDIEAFQEWAESWIIS